MSSYSGFIVTINLTRMQRLLDEALADRSSAGDIVNGLGCLGFAVAAPPEGTSALVSSVIAIVNRVRDLELRTQFSDVRRCHRADIATNEAFEMDITLGDVILKAPLPREVCISPRFPSGLNRPIP